MDCADDHLTDARSEEHCHDQMPFVCGHCSLDGLLGATRGSCIGEPDTREVVTPHSEAMGRGRGHESVSSIGRAGSGSGSLDAGGNRDGADGTAEHGRGEGSRGEDEGTASEGRGVVDDGGQISGVGNSGGRGILERVMASELGAIHDATKRIVGLVIAWGLPADETASIAASIADVVTKTELQPILTYRDRMVSELYRVHALIRCTEDSFPNEETVREIASDIVALCCCSESVGRDLIAAVVSQEDDRAGDEETRRQDEEDRKAQTKDKTPKKELRPGRKGGTKRR